MNRVVGVTAAIACGGFLSGCFLAFRPLSGEIRQVDAQLAGLKTRADRLETVLQSRSGTDAATFSTASTLAGSSAGVAAPGVSAGASGAGVGGVRAAFESAAEAGSAPFPGLALSFRKALGKLGRGLVNLATGWVEIPKAVHETTQREGAGIGLTFGLIKGAGVGFIRTVAGGYETVTFPFPAPPYYRPVMRPEFIFTCECPD